MKNDDGSILLCWSTHELAKQINSVVENLGARMDISICKVIGKTNINESINEA